MAYDKQTWVNGLAGGTPVNATRLNYMEQGLDDAHTIAEAAAPADHDHVTADITDATASNVVDTVVKRDGTGAIAVSAVSGLSEATGATQAVPKSQLDSGLATKASTGHTHVLANITDVTATGTSLATAASASAARTAISAANSTHTHPATDISDSTATGRSVVTAADAATGRTALGAAAATHTHAISDVTSLQTSLDAKLGIVSGSGLADAHKVTQAAYDALGAGRPSGRIYFIVG